MDNIKKPNHYNQYSMEVKDMIAIIVADTEGYHAYCIGNVVKYVLRYNFKNGIEDLKKALEYIKFIGEDDHYFCLNVMKFPIDGICRRMLRDILTQDLRNNKINTMQFYVMQGLLEEDVTSLTNIKLLIEQEIEELEDKINIDEMERVWNIMG